MLPFWAGDILARETRHLQQLLSSVAAFTLLQDQQGLPPSLQSLLDDAGGCISWRGASYPDSGQGNGICLEGLKPFVAEAARTGIVRTTLPKAGVSAALLASTYLYVAVPLPLPGIPREAVGVGIPFEQIFHSLWNKERVIAVYLLFNGLVLVTLAFFRLMKAYVLPVDRLIQAAESYRGDGLPPLLLEKPGNELGQLAGSIQAMVRRIEADREKLAKTVAELADKNRLLLHNQKEMVRTEKLASVGRLAAGLAHEIGNPLGVVQGYLQLLGMGGSNEQEHAEYVAKALEELGRVDGLIRQLLDYARTSKGAAELFDVHALLAELVETLRVQPIWERIALDLALGAENSVLCADREQVRQVIFNCLLNAADSIRVRREKGRGAISLTTAVDGQADGDRPLLRIAITDNGEGIPPELLDTVFDPFFTTKAPGAGTGLGLSVSLALIESMGGQIRLESVLGEGTTVLLLLPLGTESIAGMGTIECGNNATAGY